MISYFCLMQKCSEHVSRYCVFKEILQLNEIFLKTITSLGLKGFDYNLKKTMIVVLMITSFQCCFSLDLHKFPNHQCAVSIIWAGHQMSRRPACLQTLMDQSLSPQPSSDLSSPYLWPLSVCLTTHSHSDASARPRRSRQTPCLHPDHSQWPRPLTEAAQATSTSLFPINKSHSWTQSCAVLSHFQTYLCPHSSKLPEENCSSSPFMSGITRVIHV